MNCDICHKREAVIFVEQVSNDNKKKKINLCMECAVSHGINSDTESFQTNLSNLFRELAESARKLELEGNKMCPVCGTSLSEIRKNSHTGCPECYAIFKEPIQELLKDRGITGNYTGSMPARLASFHSVLNYRIMLQNKLNDAVAREDFEKAALYRDYLHALEKHPVSGDEETSSGKEVF